MSHYITIWAAGLPIGEVKGDIFHKKVRSSVHFLRKPPAICIDAQSLRDAMAAGAQRVDIEDTETGKRYHAHVDTIRKRGRYLDRGHGAQYALLLSRWEVDDPRITHNQPSLWG